MAKKRAAIYARVSHDKQRKNFSIETQIEIAAKFIAQKGYTLVGNRYVNADNGADCLRNDPNAIAAFVDDYTSLEISRPGLNAALSYLRSNGFDVLIVLSVDRLARDPYIRVTLENQFEDLGARVEYAQGDYAETDEGEVRKDLDAVFAKWENAKRLERVQRGKVRKAKERGNVVSGPAPYGYSYDHTVAGGIAPNEDAAHVKTLFELYASGYSLRGLADELDSRGIVPPRGGKWQTSSLGRILRSETYIGVYYYNRTRRVRQGIENRSEDEWIRIDVTPIISSSLFEQVQQRLGDSKEARRRQPKRFSLLSGLVRCSKCGRPFSAETMPAGKNRRINDAVYYRHRLSEGHCQNTWVNGAKLEEDVWQRLKAVVLDADKLKRNYKRYVENHNQERQVYEAHLRTLEARQQKENAKLQNLTAAYIDPEIGLSKDNYIAQKAAIENALRDIERQLKDTQARIDEYPQIDLEDLGAFVGKITRNIDRIDAKTKRKLFELLHLTVYLTPDGAIDRLEGWFNFADDSDTTDTKKGGGGASGLRPRYLDDRSSWSWQDTHGAGYAWHSTSARSRRSP